MIDIRTFSGVMDTDSPNSTIGAGSVKMARNIRYRGTKGNLRIENIYGTRLIPYNLPAGNNECIGAFFDDIKKRIIYFNYNSNGTHGIYIIDNSTETITPLLVIGGATDGDILGFTLDEPIFAVKMLYGDSVQGDTIYFNNSQKEPCQINIERTLAWTYGTMKRSFLEVIKYPASRPPYVAYGNDNTVIVNTLRKKLFKFKLIYRYYSKETSVTSQQSEVALPLNANISATDQDPTKNCKISIVYETGDADVKYVDILGAVSNSNNQFSDYFLITSINKSDAGLNNNDLAIYDFYNNQAYDDIDAEDSIQLFDYVPLEANSLEMINGTVPIYGGITEGFDLIELDASVSSGSITERNLQVPFVFISSQSGESGFGSGNIHIVFTGDAVTNVTSGQNYTFAVKTTNELVSYTPVSPTNNIISGLSAAAALLGFTVVSSDSNNLVIVKTGESLELTTVTTVLNGNLYTTVYNWNDKENYGLVYFDDADRTNGVITNVDISYQTVNYTETGGNPNLPQLTLTVNNRPPDWAKSFSPVRTKSLAKSKFFYWVTDRTYKDSYYAYVSIENLNTFIKLNPSSKFLAYDFSAGDRIRFIKVLSGTPTIYTNNDFEIISQIFNPEINGEIRNGQYLKIALPATSGTFDFGDDDFFNYFIELYTPAQSVQNGLNKYYEFGERYNIGNAGTATRYHQGGTQNQTSNLSQPAIFVFNKGDNYFRERAINTGSQYNYNVAEGEIFVGRFTLGTNFDSRTYADPNISVGNSPLQNLVGWTYASDTRAIIKMGGSAPVTNFRFEGTIGFDPLDDDTFAFFFQKSTGEIVYMNAVRGITNSPQTQTIAGTFSLSAGQHITPLGWSEADYSNPIKIFATEIRIFVDNIYTVGVIDQNYSDNFPSAVNSNGRAYVQEPIAARVYNPVLLRWGKRNELNTLINEVSRFTVLNFDEADLTKGDIEVLSIQNRVLDVLQRRGCGWYGIYSRIVKSNTGSNELLTSDDIIAKNNIQYLLGSYGVANQKTSFIKSKSGYYFTDPIRGYQIRRDANGLTPLNELYYGRFYIRNLITPYANDYERITGGKAKLIGYYDYFEEESVTIFQGGVFDGKEIISEVLSFNEFRNAYNCFFDFGKADWIICANDKTFSWKNGQIYIHDEQSAGKWCEFYNEKFTTKVSLVFNDKVQIKKTYQALSYQSNKIWQAENIGDILTSEVNMDTQLPQISQMITEDFEVNEGVTYGAFLRDANSLDDQREALINGDFLKGEWVEINLTYTENDFVFLYVPYINWIPSPRNL